MSNEYNDLRGELDSLRTQLRQLSTRGRVGNPVYGGPINAEVTSSAKTSGPFLWLIDNTHDIEIVLPVQNYVHRILDAKLRVTLRPVRAATATTGSPNITTSDDNAQASSISSSDDNAQASSISSSDDNAAGSSSVTTDDNAQASSSSTTAAEGATPVTVSSSSHAHLYASFTSLTEGAYGTDLFITGDSTGSFAGSNRINIAANATALYTALPHIGDVSVAPTSHTHGMTHTHNHHHDFTHTHNHHHSIAHTHNHHHNIAHTHNHHHTLDHTHPTTIAAGVTEGGMPSAVRVFLDTGAGYTELTGALGGPWSANFEVQLATYFNDNLQPRQPIIGNHKMLLKSSTVGTLEVNLDWFQMLKPQTAQ